MIFDWDFDAGRDGFIYRDDAFRGTSQPDYASGAWDSDGGRRGDGALIVRLGGRDDADISGMSGGWTRAFTLDVDQEVTLTFRVRLTQTANYERNEYSEALLALDGRLIGTNGRDYIARISGDGDGGPARSSGWLNVTVNFGELSAGEHRLTFGGYNNLKTDRNESTTIQFDDVVVTGKPPVGDSDGDGTGSGDGGSGGGATPPNLEAFEARVLELTNAYRVENGRTPLENDARLNAAAEDWSQEMANGDFFRHSTTAQVEEFGYRWRAWGENIAAGQSTPESVVNAWINSPGHRANMLREGYEDIGIGYAYLPSDPGNLRYKHYWTQIFGTEADSIA